MGLKIELPVYTVEEAALLTDTLLSAAKARRALASMLHATPKEAATHNHNAALLEGMLGRLSGEGAPK